MPGDLGRFDAILLSHAHHDHLDKRLRCASSTRPRRSWRRRAAARALRGSGRTVHTLGSGEELELAGVRVRAVPAVHDGRRIPVGRPTSGVGFVAGGVYFAGDTEPYPEMAELAGTLDAALVPVAGWGPRVGPGHMDPREAARRSRCCGPRWRCPIHWGTYRRIGHRPAGDPAREFVEHAARARAGRAGRRARSPAGRSRSPGRCEPRSPRRALASRV